MPSAQPRTLSSTNGSPDAKNRAVTSSDFYVHPHLVPDNDPCKGRLLRASAAVPAGTVLLEDAPYAIVPAIDPTASDALVCNKLACSRKVTQEQSASGCPRNCVQDVIWCNATCRDTDFARHEFECSWLMSKGRNLEPSTDAAGSPKCGSWKRGWESVEECCSYLTSWPESQVKHWKRLIKLYLSSDSLLPISMSPEEMLSLVCREETNTFGLYERVTGPLYMIDRPVPRGEAYGLSLYPRAAMFNHSCVPNVSHQPDGNGRMVYRAARDIQANEECVITYFDLTEFESLESRQNHVQEQFRFTCTCERCHDEGSQENLAGLESLPFSD